MTDEAVFSNFDQLANKRMRLYLCAVINSYIFLNFNKWANKNVITDDASIEIHRIDDYNVYAEININNPGLPNLGLIQNAFPSLQCLG